MEGNKDEAARCVKIAESALASGDKQRATKFIKIAQRLDPNLRVDDILTASEKLDSSNSTSGQDDIILEEVQRETKSTKESGTSNGERIYTEENVKLIQEVKKNKDYYAILGVEKSCSVEEVRKAYRKLSLKVHPDKNKAPGAEEAFKSVCKAFKCLSDEQSRWHYDQVGVAEDHDFNQQHVNVMRRRRRRATKNDFFDDDFDPDDIFRSFFFGTQGDVFRAQVHRARGMRGHQREHNVEGGVGYGFIKFLQIVPILLFFLFAFLPLWEPEYSLQKTYTYQIPKVTQKLGVEYFVKNEDFDQRFPQGSSSRNNLEHHVLRDYKSILGRYCHMELQRRHWAKNYPTPHCDKLRSLAVA